MEIREYGAIIKKRIWIPILLFVIVGGISAVLYTPYPITYTTSMRFEMGIQHKPVDGVFSYDAYYAWLASEYLVDDTTEIVQSQAFADSVNETLKVIGSNVQIPPHAIDGVMVGGKQHRILTVDVTWGNTNDLMEIAQAVQIVLEENPTQFFKQLSGVDVGSTLIDPPSEPERDTVPLTYQLDIPVRLIFAIVAGISLTFLLDYLDTSVRNAHELEQMGIAVLAEIPKK